MYPIRYVRMTRASSRVCSEDAIKESTPRKMLLPALILSTLVEVIFEIVKLSSDFFAVISPAAVVSLNDFPLERALNRCSVRGSSLRGMQFFAKVLFDSIQNFLK